jgi:hypothetical protein
LEPPIRIRIEPEVLPPGKEARRDEQSSRLRRGGSRWFDDENLDILSHLLDDCFRIPGTQIRFGLEGIIGLVPGFGDVLHGIASSLIVVAAWVRGLPYATLVRMLFNLLLDVGIGAVPFVGDIFDIAWKANRRNYALLTRHIAEPHKHVWRDWVFLGGIAAALVVLMLLPLLLLAWLSEHLLHGLFR